MDIKIWSEDVNVISMWEDAIAKYNPHVIDDIKDIKDNSIVMVDFDTLGQKLIKFLKDHPSNKAKIVVLEGHPKHQNAKILLKLGVKAYGNSYMLPVHLISCIKTVESGHIWVYPEFVYHLIEGINAPEKKSQNIREILTKRENDIVEELLAGLSNEQIANSLSISKQTVKVHLTKIYQKLKVSNRLELAMKLNA